MSSTMRLSHCPDRPVVETLEPRLLFSADLAPLALALSDLPQQGSHVQMLATSQSAAQASSQVTQAEWIFLDSGVPDLASFLKDLEQQSRAGRPLHVVVIDQGEDGLSKISHALQDQHDVGAIHIISHGSEGSVQLGTITLDAQVLRQRAGELAQWGGALSEDADLLIYGCGVGAHPKGQAFLQDLATLTGADVAASTDITGVGGNWVLEQHTGDVGTAIAVSQPLAEQWTGQLALTPPSSKGRAVWSDANVGTPVSSAWDGLTSGATAATQASSNWTVVTSAASPDGRSAIVLGVDASGNIQGERWTGTQWEALPLNPLATGASTLRQCFAVAYEQNTGNAVLAWTDSTSVKYATYSSIGWSAANTVAAYTGASPERLQIAAQPNGDQLLMTVSDSNYNDRALIWDGTAWDHEVVLDANGGTFVQQLALSAVYEAKSGMAMAIYGKDGETDLYYRSFANGAWTNETSFSLGITGQPVTIVTASDGNSDRIGLGVMSMTGSGTARQEAFARWSGSAWEAVTQVNGSTSVGGTTVSVAFEGRSGDLLAAYIGGGNSPSLFTLAANANTWSTPIAGPDMGTTIGAIRLFADPASDRIMLGVQASDGRLDQADWDGQALSAARTVSGNTGSTYTPAFTMFWLPQSDGTASTGLWLGSTTNGTGWPGLNQISNTEILTLDTGNLTLGAGISRGTLSHGWNPAAFGATNLNDMVWVSQPVSVGNGYNLQRGDILFTLGSTTTLQGSNNVTAASNDVVRFRPTTAGDYSSGTFTVILSGLGANVSGNGANQDVQGLALVEQDVVVGDQQLRAGDFLFTVGNGSTGRDIYLQSFVNLGLLLTSSTTRLIAGNDLGINRGIAALELISVATTLGGQSLAKGSLLITLDGADTVASNDLAVQRRDVVKLTVSRTSVNATASATASLLLDGSSMGTPDVVIDGLALVQAASPVITSGTNPTFEVNVAENQRAVTTVRAQDSQGGSNVTYAIGGGADADQFTIDTNGVLTFKTQNVPDREAPTDANGDGVYEVVVTASEGKLADQQRIRVVIDDVNEAPVMAGSTLAVTAIELRPANVTLATVTATDPEGQALSYAISGGADASYFEIDSVTGDLRFKSQPDTLAAPYDTHALNFAVQVAASDGTFTTTREVAVTLNKANRPPTNTLPAQPDTLEDTPLVLRGLSVNDPDAGTATMTVTLTVSEGALSLNTQVSGGVQASDVEVVDGGKTLIIRASCAAINASLADNQGLTYRPEPDAHGLVTLTMVSDDGGNTGVAQQPEQRSDTDAIRITVVPVNDRPVLVQNDTLSVGEGQAVTLNGSLLSVTDVDNTSAELRYSLSTQPGHGHLALAQAPLEALTVQDTFTQAQIDAGQVIYVHDGSETLQDSFELRVTDGAGGELTGISVQVGITPVNDIPVMQSLNALQSTEGQTTPLTRTQLAFADADAGAEDLSYSITQAAAHGHLARVDAPQQALTGANAFTQAQIDAGQIVYVHDGSEGLEDSITLSLSDGQGGQVNGLVLRIQIQPVNDAPVLDTHEAMGVDEGQTASLTSALLRVIDADNTPTDLRFTLTTLPAHGHLALAQAPQTALTAQDTFTQAQINAGEVIYVHDGSEASLDSLQLRVSDGAGGELTDITIQVRIAPVNDTPSPESTQALQVIEGQAATLSHAQLAFTDADNTPAELTYSITQAAAHGHLALAGSPQQALTSADTFTQAQVDAGQIVYVHDGSDTLADTVTLSLSDGSGAPSQSITLSVQVQAVEPPPEPAPISLGIGVAPSLPTASDDPQGDAADDTQGQAQGANDGNAKTGSAGSASAIDPMLLAKALTAVAYTPPMESLSDTVASISLQPAASLPQVITPKPNELQERAEEQEAFSFRWTGSLQPGQAADDISRSLADLRETLTDADGGHQHALMTSSIAVSTGLSVGYVIWLVRGGALVGSMLSSMPLWNMVDPLPVLSRTGAGGSAKDGHEEGDSPLENLFDGRGKEPTRPAPPTPQAMTSSTEASTPPDGTRQTP